MATIADVNVLRRTSRNEVGGRFLAFAGTSMEPTLSAGRVLELAACEWREVRVGDVIAFRKAGWREVVVHRVIGSDRYGLRTCGDSNVGEDPWLVRSDEFVGRVEAAWRGSKRSAVAGGRLGRLMVFGLRTQNRMMWMVRAALRSPYRWLAEWRILGGLLPRSLRPRLVRFQSHGEHRLRVMVGQRVAGWFDEGLGAWVIPFPYRLLVRGCGLRVSFEMPRNPTFDRSEG